MFMYTLSLMIGTAGLPHVIIRFFTVPKVKDARSSAGWALVFIAILYTTAPSVAAMARLNLIETIQPTGGQHMVYDERPNWVRNWEATGLLAFEDKNGDGMIQYSADAATNEVTKIDRDIMVLANPEIAASAELGNRSRRRRWSCRGAIHCCWFATCHILRDIA